MVRIEEAQHLLKHRGATDSEAQFAVAGFKDGWRTGWWKGFFVGLPVGAIVLGVVLALA